MSVPPKADVVRDGRQLMENDYGVDSCYLPALGEWVSVPHRWSGRFSVDIAPAVDAYFDAPPHPNYRYQPQGNQ